MRKHLAWWLCACCWVKVHGFEPGRDNIVLVLFYMDFSLSSLIVGPMRLF